MEIPKDKLIALNKQHGDADGKLPGGIGGL